MKFRGLERSHRENAGRGSALPWPWPGDAPSVTESVLLEGPAQHRPGAGDMEPITMHTIRSPSWGLFGGRLETSDALSS